MGPGKEEGQLHYHHDGATTPPNERTALLALPPHHQPRHSDRRSPSTSSRLLLPQYEYETEDDEIDANESDLLLARTASVSSAAGLAPESFESAMLRRGGRPSPRRLSDTIASDCRSIDEDPLFEAKGHRHHGRHHHHHGVEGAADDETEAEAEAEVGCSSSSGEELSLEADTLLEAGGAAPRKLAFLIETDPSRFQAIFMGIMFTHFMACFDGTIMASSHPVITSYFRSSNSASWLSTAFLLTSTAFQPVVGRLSDSLGRKGPYLFVMGVFAAATAWCGVATSMTSFIIARAFCGVGAGGVLSLGSIIISDIVNIERRGAYQSYVNAVYGLASAAGAALGGLMADTLGWRWEFGVQVPPILICMAVAYFVIPDDLGVNGRRETFREAMKAFDFKGSILLTVSTTFLILGLSLGGNVIPWSHPFIVVSLMTFLVSFPLCLWAEAKAKRPIMPLALLCSAPRANMIFSNFIGAIILNAILFNIPLYFQAVLLTSATESGIRLVVPQVTAASIGVTTGFLVSATRRLKWPLVLGSSLTVIGTTLLTGLQRGWPTWGYLLALVPSSAGQGFMFPGTFIAVLAASAQPEQAVVTSTLVLWRALGNVLGVAGSSLVLQNALLAYLREYVTEGDAAYRRAVIEKVRESVEAVARLEGPVRDQVVRSYEAAIRVTFLCTVGAAVLAWLMLLPIRLPRLGKRK